MTAPRDRAVEPIDPDIDLPVPAQRRELFFFETLRLAEGGARFCAAANVIVGVVAGLGAAFVGAAFAQAVWA